MKTISFPFRLDGFGKVATTTDMSRIWADRVRAVVSTYPGERLMRSGFGTALPDNLFAAVQDSPEFIDILMADSFEAWLPTLILVGVDYAETGLAEVSVQVNYSVPSLEKNSDYIETITL